MPFMGIEHWTIAICDDDEIFLSRLEKQIRAELQQLNVVGEIVSYTDSEKLLETKLHQTEIFFLDIDLNAYYSGIELVWNWLPSWKNKIRRQLLFLSAIMRRLDLRLFTISHFVSLEKRIYRRNFRKRCKA